MLRRRFGPLGVACAGVLVAGSLGCDGSPITAGRLEASIAGTFANLVHLQLARTGLAPLAVADIKVKATCHRPVGGARGAGAWICTLAWAGPNGTVLQDTFDLSVGTDGCYTASVDPTESQLGGPTITSTSGTIERNLLYTFEGCFDTT